MKKPKQAKPVANVEPASGDMQMVTVALPREVHRALRFLSIERRVTMAELIRNSIDSWLPLQTESKSRKRKGDDE